MFNVVTETIAQVRNVRNSKNISPKQKLTLYLKAEKENVSTMFHDVIIKLCNLDKFELTSSKIENAVSFIVQQFEFYIPLEGNINIEEEKERLTKELEYNKGFLKSVQIKLSNENFVAKAKPELIELERKKLADAQAKIKALQEQLTSL